MSDWQLSHIIIVGQKNIGITDQVYFGSFGVIFGAISDIKTVT